MITNVPSGTGNGLIATYASANNFHLTNNIFNDQVHATTGVRCCSAAAVIRTC